MAIVRNYSVPNSKQHIDDMFRGMTAGKISKTILSLIHEYVDKNSQTATPLAGLKSITAEAQLVAPSLLDADLQNKLSNFYDNISSMEYTIIDQNLNYWLGLHNQRYNQCKQK